MSEQTNSDELTSRQRLLWGMYDFQVGHGLEIGPLNQCIAPRSRTDVEYVDVFHRGTLVSHYADDVIVSVEEIPEIDYPLSDGDRVRTIDEAVGRPAVFDWVVASHVVEHVPDLVGWLRQIAEVTKDGGDLVLAVPDRRYCFDLHRPATTVGQMVQAHDLGDRVPSVRAVFDSTRAHAPVPAPQAWACDPVGYENRICSLDHVLRETDKARRGEYVDAHVWTFTPGSFLEAIHELRAIGLCEWRVTMLRRTRRGNLEFYVVLTRLPRSGDWPAELFADEPKPGRMPDWLEETSTNQRNLAAALRDLRRSQREVEKLTGQVDKLRAQRQTMKARLDRSPRRRVRRALDRVPGGTALLRAYRSKRR